MNTRSGRPQRFCFALRALARQGWALGLILAAGCSGASLHVGGPDSSANVGGAAAKGGANGEGGQGDAASVAGTGGSAASGGSGGLTDSGRNTGSGGLGGSGGAIRTGGTAGTGGAVGTGGIGAAGGTTGSGAVLGQPCATDQDCSSNAICCDGSSESCDGTRLPSGDGANAGEFAVSADGLTVTDSTTGLVWQRAVSSARPGCSVNGGLACTWAEAQAYCASLVLGGTSGWRLPAWMELLTLVDLTTKDEDRFAPAIDQTAFPNTSGGFWTSTAHGTVAQHVFVNFADGTSIYCGEMARGVRCVRGSRCYPTSRFVVLAGGLVRDTLTGLVWQQQGSATAMPWADGQSYCSSLGSGFRLPTLKELDSLMDPTLPSGGTIDEIAFPWTGTDVFWTSTPYMGPSLLGIGDRRYGDFANDYANECEFGGATWSAPDNSHLVRCVH